MCAKTDTTNHKYINSQTNIERKCRKNGRKEMSMSHLIDEDNDFY